MLRPLLKWVMDRIFARRRPRDVSVFIPFVLSFPRGSCFPLSSRPFTRSPRCRAPSCELRTRAVEAEAELAAPAGDGELPLRLRMCGRGTLDRHLDPVLDPASRSGSTSSSSSSSSTRRPRPRPPSVPRPGRASGCAPWRRRRPLLLLPLLLLLPPPPPA